MSAPAGSAGERPAVAGDRAALLASIQPGVELAPELWSAAADVLAFLLELAADDGAT